MRITVIGGGTGLSTLLRGLKNFSTFELTAVVTITDEGGSSGRIREELNVPPPGDVRNNISALAEDENLLSKLIRFRFQDEGTFNGHSVGNIIIAALTKILGSFPEAVQSLSNVLAIQGQVLPVSEKIVRLYAENDRGETLLGETSISENMGRIISLRTDSAFPALENVIKNIEEAEGIILGPGSLYTSIIPNLLADGVKEAINNNDCAKIYVSNIMMQPGETIGYSLSDHVNEILKYLNGKIDFVVANSQKISREICDRYKIQGADQVKADIENVESQVISDHLIDIMIDERDGLAKVRHDGKKLGNLIINLLDRRSKK